MYLFVRTERMLVSTDHPLWPRLNATSGGARMTFRYETEVFDHTVTVSRNTLGRYEVFLNGPLVSAKYDRTFSTLYEAKTEGHGFAHSALQAHCECEGLYWRIVPED